MGYITATELVAIARSIAEGDYGGYLMEVLASEQA